MKLSVLKIELGKTATARMISFCVLGLKSVNGKGKYEYIFLGRVSISVIYVCVCLKMFTFFKEIQVDRDTNVTCLYFPSLGKYVTFGSIYYRLESIMHENFMDMEFSFFITIKYTV